MSFQAGAAKINITPPLGTRINGDFITHFAWQIHDDLYARALVLRDTSLETIVFLVVDTCIIPRRLADKIRKKIAKTTRIPAPNIMISSTHTHAAGSLADVHLGSIDLDYTRSLPAKLVNVVFRAIERLRPAKIGFTSVGVPEHVVCRRYFMKNGYGYPNPVTGKPDRVKTNPVGAEASIDKRVAEPDPQLACLAVFGTDGRWISLLANYSLHYVGDWPNGTISADYFGVFASSVERGLDPNGEMVAIMTNGTSGDVNIWDFLQPDRYPSVFFEKSKLIGEDLASKLLKSLDTIVWEKTPALKSAYTLVPLDTEKPSDSEISSANKIVKSTNYETINPETPDDIRALYAREQLLLQYFPDTSNCPVQVFRIGHIVIGALAGEFFAETGIWLKQKLEGTPYFTITMANGNIGYVPPKEQFLLGGYETWRCRYRCAAADSEEKIKNTLADLASALQEA